MMYRYGILIIEHIEYLYALIPLTIALIYIITRKYIKEEQRITSSRWKKVLLFISRLLFFVLLLLALGNPHFEYTEKSGEVSSLKVLIDNSDSMKLFDLDDIDKLIARIEAKGISVSSQKVEMGDFSTIGSEILKFISPNENLLLVSDGQNNFGSSLEEVALFAASIDSKIYALELDQRYRDSSIRILGPKKGVSGIENTFTVKIDEFGDTGKNPVSVYIDDELVLETKNQTEFEIKESFKSGTHTIKAVMHNDDFFQDNNYFYKTITIHSKPKILYVTEDESPLTELYSLFYDLVVTDEITNQSAADAYTIVLNNMRAKSLSETELTILEGYVEDGNGLLVIGGKNAYENGNYNYSSLRNILPVGIGKAQKKDDAASIAVLMDTGTGAFNSSWDIQPIDIQKAVATDLIRSITDSNLVAVLEANFYLNKITGISELGPKRRTVLEEISLIQPHGASEFSHAYKESHAMLKFLRGGKYITLITDGDVIPYEKANLLKLVEDARSDGIRTFVLGATVPTKSVDTEYLLELAFVGDGEFIPLSDFSRVNLYFGNPNSNKGDLSMFIYDSNHFITKDVKELGYIYGYNSVYPKKTARMLLSSSTGDPILTVWNYGLGRVAALSTDDGTSWVPDLLGQKDSVILIRTLNWLIENPERKNDLIIEFPDIRLGEDNNIIVKTKKEPESKNLKFYEVSKDVFAANYYPNETGIKTVLDIPVGVNYKKEYLNIGFNEELADVLAISNGEVLENDADKIIEKLKNKENVETLKQVKLGWLFVTIAALIFIGELVIRRIHELKLSKEY